MKYSEKDLRELSQKGILFTHHAEEQMVLPERNLTGDEVKNAIIRGKIVDIEKTHPCDKITITAHDPTITVVVGISDLNPNRRLG
ncbi:MAG: DUF4258 domain-containing protein [Methanosarcinales archaeon]